MITPQEAIAEAPEESIKSLEPGIDQMLNNQFIKWGDVVKVDLAGQSEKVLKGLATLYTSAGWTVTQEKSALLFTAAKSK